MKFKDEIKKNKTMITLRERKETRLLMLLAISINCLKCLKVRIMCLNKMSWRLLKNSLFYKLRGKNGCIYLLFVVSVRIHMRSDLSELMLE